MHQNQAAAIRRRLELYRECLAKGVDGGMGMICLIEIVRLEKVLDQPEVRQERENP